jgi:hypothetical protein
MADKWLGDPIGDAYRKPEGWQPIETAPKDGTRVLVFDQYWGVLMSYWQLQATAVNPPGREHDRWDWYAAPGATHWMPLPAPPEAQ